MTQLDAVVALTNDRRSRRRFEQLLGLVWSNGAFDAWDEAMCSTRKRLEDAEQPPLEKPGAYFQSTLAAILLDRGVSVPVGNKAERASVRTEIAASLGLDIG